MDPNDRYKVYAMDDGCDVTAPSGRVVITIPWNRDNTDETKQRAWDMVVILNEMRYMQQVREGVANGPQ